jgi:hypothetical protein
MKFSSFVHKKLIDLLNDRRIVVWYDAERDFRAFADAFNAPNCEVLSAETSVLKTRRRADEVYRLMNESENPTERDRCLLIYIPKRRGATENEKMRDPFEVYAMAGAAFGATEDQRIESLARQTMPQMAEEITRLFREGRPDVALLDGLEKGQRWPLLSDVFRTETTPDVIALALCDMAKAKEVDDRPGCIEELLRFFESVVGFKPASESRKWKTLRPKAAEYVLFSEFVIDLPNGEPDALSAVPRARADAKSVVCAACDRLRADSGLREIYTELAQKIENDLRLSEIMPKNFDPGERDTFPFEERQLLARAVESVVGRELAAAKRVIENRKRSIWRRDPQRSPAWTTLERTVTLVEAASTVSHALSDKKNLGGLVAAYTEGGWSDLDRASRLFETALTACPDEEGLAPLVELGRRRYREVISKMQDAFLAAVQVEGWPPDGAPRQTRIFDDHIAPVLERRERIAFFMVDSLRYEMGCDLGEVFSGHGEVQVRYAAGVVPTVTITGAAALMPGADGIFRLVERDGGLIPALGARLLRTSADRMKLLAEIYGDRLFETTMDDLLGAPKKVAAGLTHVELLVVRTQDPDSIGENLGSWRARRYLSEVVGDIASAIRWVVSHGFNRVVITSDHGHMMLPEIPPGDVVQSPAGGWLESKRRCRLGSGLSGTSGTITLKAGHVGIKGDLQEICLPIGFRVFSDGPSYFHGGLSLQEAIIPVIIYRAEQDSPAPGGKPEIEIRYRSEKFTSRVIGLKFHLQSDMFGTAFQVKIEAYDGTGAKPKLVGEAADCEARDEKTREVTLPANKETPVPVLVDPDFNGSEIEIRVSDPLTRVVWARRKLKNSMLD